MPPVRAFVTGTTGFIGGRVAAQLRERGDEVVALVRSSTKTGPLRLIGCEFVEGDLFSADALRAGMEGCDAVLHIAGVYKVGVPASEVPAMMHANVDGTAAALDAAIAAGVPRTLYVSTVNVFGNTHGRAVDESFRRDLSEGFLSAYDESKYRAHEVTEDRIANGAPVIIAQPCGVYGPGDTSELGHLIEQVSRGRMPLIPFADMGIGLSHVDDIATGILLALDKGTIGESYVLSGELVRMRELVEMVARAAGRRPPRLAMPTAAMRLSAPLMPLVGPMLGFPPNMRETIAASDGVTYWATDAKARRELGYTTRPLEQGLRETLAA